MMNLWYNQSITIQSLSSLNQLDEVFNFIINNINNMNNDFEIKRLIIGLSTLALSANSHELDQRVQSRFQDFMKAILFLCQKSLQLREKKQKKIEEAQEDKDCEKGVIYDEDEDGDGEINIDLDEEEDEEDEWQLESDDEGEQDLYETKLDKVDDILYVQEMLNTLQQQNPQHWNNILQVLDEGEKNGLMNFFQQAQIYKTNKDALEQQRAAEEQQRQGSV